MIFGKSVTVMLVGLLAMACSSEKGAPALKFSDALPASVAQVPPPAPAAAVSPAPSPSPSPAHATLAEVMAELGMQQIKLGQILEMADGLQAPEKKAAAIAHVRASIELAQAAKAFPPKSAVTESDQTEYASLLDQLMLGFEDLAAAIEAGDPAAVTAAEKKIRKVKLTGHGRFS